MEQGQRCDQGACSNHGETGKQNSGTPKCISSIDSPPALLSKIGLKAGMQGIDKAKVNQIIFEASKGSKFHKNELRKDEKVEKKIGSMMDMLKKVTDTQKADALKVVDREIELLEKTRDLSHVIVHVDMDAFYAAVEMRDDPKLKDVPMAVGSTGMLVSLFMQYRYRYSIIHTMHRVHIGCLLYTSPSPRDATLSRMPSSA